jgi:hypothetical protein
MGDVFNFGYSTTTASYYETIKSLDRFLKFSRSAINMRNPKISAARTARAQYNQYLKKLERQSKLARDVYAISLRELAIDKFINLHAREGWPQWMEKRACFNVEFDQPSLCKVSVTVRIDGKMPDGYFWAEIEGKKILASLNECGETRFVIQFDPPPAEIITIFEASVDPESLAISVIIALDPNAVVLPPPEFFYDGW